MWSHYLVTLYRALTRHRLYAALNIFGLAVGIAVFLVLWLDVKFETGFEKFIPDAGQIYQLRSQWHVPGAPTDDAGSTMGGLLEELRGDYPDLVGTRMWDRGATLRQGSELRSESITIVDPGFFRVFDLPLAEGDRASALRAPDSLVLTRSKARQYFGDADPLGRRLAGALDGSPHTFRITGVLADPPKSSDLKLDFLASITPQLIADADSWRHWGSEHLGTYLRFATPSGAHALEADLPRFIDRHAGADISTPPAPHEQFSLKLRPLRTLHVVDDKVGPVIAALSAVGVLTLLLAAVNYVNLATARAGLRAREVAIRKVMGATPSILFGQFMAESVVTAALATLIGLALCELALPLVNAAGGLALHLDYLNPDGPLPPVLIAMAVVGVGAGLYPAAVLSRFRAAQVLASARAPGGGKAGGRVREVLVIGQFAIAIAFAVATGVIFVQMRYLRSADVGFRRDGLIVVSSFDDAEVTPAERASLLEAWKAVPGVTSDTSANIAPANDDNTNATNFKRPGQLGDGPSVNYVFVKPGFFDTYGAHMLEGRALDVAHGGDEPELRLRVHRGDPAALYRRQGGGAGGCGGRRRARRPPNAARHRDQRAAIGGHRLRRRAARRGDPEDPRGGDERARQPVGGDRRKVHRRPGEPRRCRSGEGPARRRPVAARLGPRPARHQPRRIRRSRGPVAGRAGRAAAPARPAPHHRRRLRRRRRRQPRPAAGAADRGRLARPDRRGPGQPAPHRLGPGELWRGGVARALRRARLRPGGDGRGGVHPAAVHRGAQRLPGAPGAGPEHRRPHLHRDRPAQRGAAGLPGLGDAQRRTRERDFRHHRAGGRAGRLLRHPGGVPRGPDRLHQGDGSTTRRFGGLGAGLTIAKAFAERMGGGLACESISGVGSSFWFEAPAPACDAEQPISCKAKPATPSLEHRMRVLLADDHPANRKIVEIILGPLAELISVEDGAQAVQAFREHSPDLVLMDMQMPVMDGLAAIREIRRLQGDAPSRAPIIMLTANALTEHVRATLEAGADMHLAKPVRAATLLQAIDAVFEDVAAGEPARAA